MDQRPLLIRSPIFTACLFCMTDISLDVSRTGRSLSQNIPSDMRGRCMFGKMLACRALDGSCSPRWDRSSDAVCVAWIVLPSGIPTTVPADTFILLVQGVLHVIKLPVVPESATAL